MTRVDPLLLGLAEAWVRPGDCVWDVGANLGLFSVAAANMAGRDGAVVAFEADTWLVGLLRRTASMQPPTAAPIEVVPSAVADATGLRHFNVTRRSRALNHLVGVGSGVAQRTKNTAQTVVSMTLDSLLPSLRAPNVLKVDVEGAEMLVLKGATTVLREHRPIIICETGDKAADEVSQLLHAQDYVLFDSSQPSATRKPVDRAPWDMLALPRERV